MTDHEFAIDFVARMRRLVHFGTPVSVPIDPTFIETATSDPLHMDAVRMLEERLAGMRKKIDSANKLYAAACRTINPDNITPQTELEEALAAYRALGKEGE